MKSVKVSNTLNGIESSGTIKILTTITKVSYEILKEKPFPDAYINEAIEFLDKKKTIEERLNQMQDELNSFKRGGQFFPSYQSEVTKEAENAEAENVEVEVPNIVDVEKNTQSKKTVDDEEINKILLAGMLGALEEDEEGFN